MRRACVVGVLVLRCGLRLTPMIGFAPGGAFRNHSCFDQRRLGPFVKSIEGTEKRTVTTNNNNFMCPIRKSKIKKF